MKKITTILFFLLLLYADGVIYAACSGSSPTLTAASASRNDVNDCVTAAIDGDTILIPNGSSTWSSGISTSKQIKIEAENYTATPAGTEGSGATSRNVVLTNSMSSGHMFAFTTGSNYSSGIGGIQFNNNSASGGFISFTGTGTKPWLVYDCYFSDLEHQGWPDSHRLQSETTYGGIMWNCVWVGTLGNDCSSDMVGELAIRIYSNWAWESNSTMGSDDTNGNINVYFEDSTFKNLAIVPDIDDNGRFVARHCIFDGAWAETHGFTSTWGGRHFEFYDNEFKETTSCRNIAGRYFWLRAGTGIFTDNDVADPQDGNYGSTYVQIDIGDNTSPGSYPQERQPGYGYENSSHVSDPVYIWNQTGAGAYDYGFNNGWDSIVVLNRDLYVNNGAKPDYSKYEYPHPTRSSSPVSVQTIKGISIR